MHESNGALTKRRGLPRLGKLQELLLASKVTRGCFVADGRHSWSSHSRVGVRFGTQQAEGPG